jgi:hypothetical protein
LDHLDVADRPPGLVDYMEHDLALVLGRSLVQWKELQKRTENPFQKPDFGALFLYSTAV